MNTDYLLLSGRHIYPQLKTQVPLRAAAAAVCKAAAAVEATTKGTLWRRTTSQRNIGGSTSFQLICPITGQRKNEEERR